MENQQTFSGGFGELLKTHRKRRRLTQKFLAQQLGVHMNTVSSWELGTYLPDTRGVVLELARFLALDEAETRRLLEASLTALSPHWHVPFPRNPFFTGREEILEALHTHLGTEQVVALTQFYALHGLGGVGKTQVALEYAYRYTLDYRAVFWLAAETAESLVSSLLRIASVLQLPERDDPDQQRVAASVRRWLSTHDQWLLIWDNVEDLALLERFLPPTRQGAILITTRCQTVGTLARSLPLLPMDQEEGVCFLLCRTNVLEPAATREQGHQLAAQTLSSSTAARDLVELMGGLPLALDQAGAYIEETGCGLSGYLQRYKQQYAPLLARRGVLGGGHPASVTTTFTLARERVEREHNLAADLLWVCAALHAEAIPEEVVLEGAMHLGPVLASLTSDPSQFDQAVAVLLNLSLVQRHPETRTLSIHRLVQAVLHTQAGEQEQLIWLERVIAALNKVFPEVTYEVWGQAERLLPHVLSVATAIPDQEGDQDVVDVLRKAADYLLARAQYEQAEPLYLRALRVWEQVVGPEHLAPTDLFMGLATLYHKQGKYEQAEPLLLNVLHIREQAGGPEHPDVAPPLSALGLLYGLQEKNTQAESMCLRALHIWEQAGGPEHPRVASALALLANLYHNQGKYEQAEPLYLRALHIWEQTLGSEHPEIAENLNDLAALYNEQGKYGQAEPLFERALCILEQTLGPEHPNIAMLLNNLAALYFFQGREDQVEPFLLRALHIWEQAFGPEHPSVAHPLNRLAALYSKQKRLEQAESLYKRAWAIAECALGTEHPRVAISLQGLAGLYVEQGNLDQAETLYQRALSIQEREPGQDRPETAQSLAGLARLYEKQGKVEQAEVALQRAFTIFAQRLGLTHPETVKARNSLRCLQEQRKRSVSQTVKKEQHVPINLLQERVFQNTLHSDMLSKEVARDPEEDDPLKNFLTSCCELHPRARSRSADLWQAYVCWIEEHQERFPLSRGAFIVQLKAHGCRASRTKTARIWHGIALAKKNDVER